MERFSMLVTVRALVVGLLLASVTCNAYAGESKLDQYKSTCKWASWFAADAAGMKAQGHSLDAVKGTILLSIADRAKQYGWSASTASQLAGVATTAAVVEYYKDDAGLDRNEIATAYYVWCVRNVAKAAASTR